MLMCNGGNIANVDKGQCGVGGRLDPDQFRLWSNKTSNVDLDAGAEGDLDIVREGYFGEVAMCAAVDIRDGYDVRASGERLKDVGGGSRAGAEGECIAGMLESSNCALKVVSVVLN